MVERLKRDLADNYHETSDEVLTNLIEYYSVIASNSSNREEDDELLEPYIYTAVKSAYLRRGDEGLVSSSEGNLNASYIDIEEKLKRDVRAIRVGMF